MRPLVVCALLSLCGCATIPRSAKAQIDYRAAVIPLVLSDTLDERLATSLRDALARTQPHMRVRSQRDLEETLQIEHSDTLSLGDLRVLGRFMGVDVIVGVHGCPEAKACLWVFAKRHVWPSSPDTLRLQGPTWINAATDSLALRYFSTPPGS